MTKNIRKSQVEKLLKLEPAQVKEFYMNHSGYAADSYILETEKNTKNNKHNKKKIN